MDPTNLGGSEDIICLCDDMHQEILCDINQNTYRVYSLNDISVAVSKRIEHQKIELNEAYRELNIIYLKLQCNDLIYVFINNTAEKEKFMRLFESFIFTNNKFVICSNECLNIAETTYKNVPNGHIYMTQKLKKYLVNDIESLTMNFKRTLNIKSVSKNKKRKQLFTGASSQQKRIKSTTHLN
jgi:hypothetical protein